jgi:hypothetical protein
MTVFIVSDTEFGWEEIVTAAEFWGEWQPFVEQPRPSLACLQLSATKRPPKPSKITPSAPISLSNGRGSCAIQDWTVEGNRSGLDRFNKFIAMLKTSGVSRKIQKLAQIRLKGIT